MSRYTGPKLRLCRREGINLFGNERYNPAKKSHPPGMHGPKGSFSKPSEYSRQLREKQKLKRLYGVTERQLSNYFTKAAKKKEITGNALLGLLETRLDNTVFRAGLAKSRPQARQMVNHGTFRVNGTRVNVPSFQVKMGDKIEVVERLRNSKMFADLEKQKFAPAKWIKVDYAKIAGEVVRALEPEDLEKVVQTSLVVEYFSK
ncbi:MAG TPA: 30S ribosomal protein S4 [Candidatus Gracilibacteria bacterium]|nr:30S ribosomal protein S4 [Candidatus Gracilibacteria bacterium]